MKRDKIKSAPWDKPSGDKSAKLTPKRVPESEYLGQGFEIDRGVRRDPTPPPSKPRPPVGAPPPPPSLGMANGGRIEEEDSFAYWSESGADAGIAGDPPQLDEPLSGTDDWFDPATGWDLDAVTDGSIDAIDDPLAPVGTSWSPTSSASSQPAPAPPAPKLWTPEPLPPPSSDEEAQAAAPLPELPDFTGEHWNLPPGPATGAKVDKPEPEPEPDLPPPGPDDSQVAFDDDGFLSIADVPAPTSTTTADEVGPVVQSFADVAGPAYQAPAPAAPAPAEGSVADIEISIDDSQPDLGDQVFSEARLPSIPPDLAMLPLDEALGKAQEFFGTGQEELGMALLESARIQAPDDPRLATWLEYGERRIMLAACPGATFKRTPALTHPRTRLAAVTAGDQRTLVMAIDGQHTLAQLREALPQIPAVGFWKELGKLQQRGWLRWTD